MAVRLFINSGTYGLRLRAVGAALRLRLVRIEREWPVLRLSALGVAYCLRAASRLVARRYGRLALVGATFAPQYEWYHLLYPL